MMRHAPFLLIVLALAATGCERAKKTEALDKELLNEADPALTSALEDQIVVDPAVAEKARKAGATVKPDGSLAAPAPKPAGGQTLGDLATAQKQAATQDCVKNVQHGVAWAKRLPAAIPIYPGAAVKEAAGNDRNGCTLRVVNFTTPTPLKQVVDYYYTQAMRAGYTADHQVDGAEHLVGGTKAADDGAFVVALRPIAGGTDVDIVANNGR